MLLKNFPGSEVCFVDFSEPMIRAVREKTADTPRTMIVQADFTTPEWTQAVPAHLAFDVVVSGFAIHHQTNDRKRELFAEIYHLLVDGGVFLNLEHVASETAAVEAVFDSYFVDHLETFHTSQGSSGMREEIEASYYARPDKKENILAPVQDQCAWLRQVGFSDVDCFFKLFELALFGGRKPLG